MHVVTFGEVMLRMAPEEFLRIPQVLPGRLEATFGGGEVNVAVSIARQGGCASFLTSLPDNPLTDAFEAELRKFHVGTELIHRRDQGRFGVYYVETGANQRAGTVVYDRDHSSISLTPADAYDWETAFSAANWFHITGITPAISAAAADASIAAVQQAKQRGLTVSCDLNFRKKLWNWQPGTGTTELAQQTLQGLMPYVDVVIANEEDADKMLGIRADNTDVEAGQISVAAYETVARQIVTRYPNVSQVAITLRESLSASHNNWGAMLFDVARNRSFAAPLDGHGNYRPYEIRNIVDRVGAGDSFAGAFVFALNSPELSAPESALRYAVAASCLKHSIKGDFNYATRAEIEALVAGSGSGRVQR
jgi:2-dehydro-3-deoxygluconokinase